MCGVEMNHHADKLIEPTTAEESKLADSALGGFVEEIFGCPECGNVESRRAR
jgi:predicted RNA-binding Zn-ribbon protein involved in translation (DUF1610 family)